MYSVQRPWVQSPKCLRERKNEYMYMFPKKTPKSFGDQLSHIMSGWRGKLVLQYSLCSKYKVDPVTGKPNVVVNLSSCSKYFKLCLLSILRPILDYKYVYQCLFCHVLLHQIHLREPLKKVTTYQTSIHTISKFICSPNVYKGMDFSCNLMYIYTKLLPTFASHNYFIN